MNDRSLIQEQMGQNQLRHTCPYSPQLHSLTTLWSLLIFHPISTVVSQVNPDPFVLHLCIISGPNKLSSLTSFHQC